MIMENDIFSVSLPISNQNPLSLEEASSNVLSGPLIHPDALANNSQRHIMAGYPLFSTLQEEAINNLHITNDDNVDSEMAASRYMSLACSTYGSTDLREHLVGNSLSAVSIANLLSGSTNVPENIDSSIPSASTLQTDEMRTFISNNSCNTLNSSLSVSDNCAYGSANDAQFLAKRDLNVNEQNFRWNCDEIMDHHVLPGRTLATVRPSYHVISSCDAAWMPSKSTLNSNDPYTYCMPRSELSLTLGSSQLPIVDMPSIPDQCSEISCSGITQVTSKDTRYRDAPELQVGSHFVHHSANDVALGMGLPSRHSLPRNEDLSLDCGSSRQVHFSHMLLASRYLHVAQQVLSEVTSHALENQNELDDSATGLGITSASSDELQQPSGERRSHGHVELLLQRHEPKTKKTELISMLQLIDYSYNKCMDQIQNVVTAFREATNSGATQLPARFALRAISILYKTLRERITSQILLISQHLGGEFMFEKEKSLESSFLQKQWALQQLRRNDQQSWRPQRGLPEKSVAVLRAWMFQNFLHPYPKDSEKQLLAIRSGLTRSQVSNWFINARVRLWKPLIEEMYSEISRKNRADEGMGDHRKDANSGSQRTLIN